MTIPKQDMATVLSSEQAKQLVDCGALTLEEDNSVDVQLIAVGAYQLQVCQEVAQRLREKNIGCRLTYLLEPGRFRIPRDEHEERFVSTSVQQAELFDDAIGLRIFVSHLRPEVLLGVCRPLDLGRDRCLAFGYRNRGGTLDTQGLLKANGCNAESIVEAITSRMT